MFVRFNENSFKSRLIGAFILTSIIPIIFFNFFSYYINAKIVKENIDELSTTNLQQTASSLDIWLDSYSDILYQIYTNDEIVDLVDKINKEEDTAVAKNQLRRTLRGLFYTKEYIKSISVITDNETVVFYDQLTASNTSNSWMSSFNISQKELYDGISEDNKLHIYSTQKAAKFATQTYYLFHIGHRIIDYKDVDKKSGVVIVSIDEKMLQSVCGSMGDQSDMNSFNFIVDEGGSVVSYIDSNKLGTKITEGNSYEDKENAYRDFVNNNQKFDDEYTSIYIYYDDTFGWDIINVSNQSKVIARLEDQQKLLAITIFLSLLAVVTIILILTKHLTGSIDKVVNTMKTAGSGMLSARVEIDSKMPTEIKTIALEFDKMLEKVEKSIEKEKEANKNQRDAQIKALEAQINPHFLYNTLDTINWMAIDHDNYEISNAINALATILRYGLDNSDGIVTVRQEIEWLKKYIFLQQTRLKNTFHCDLHVEPEILNYRIHKLLLQPFVENAILHGFDGVNREYKLIVEIRKKDQSLTIQLYDNGKGMDEDIVLKINQGIFTGIGEKNHIGMENAITRLHMYYGEQATVEVTSIHGKETTIMINIPIQELQ